MPQSAGRRLAGVAGSVPVSRQAGGCAGPGGGSEGPAWPRGRGGAGGSDGQSRAAGALGSTRCGGGKMPQPQLVLVQARSGPCPAGDICAGHLFAVTGTRAVSVGAGPAGAWRSVRMPGQSAVGEAARAAGIQCCGRSGGGPRPGVMPAALAARAPRERDSTPRPAPSRR